MVSHHQALPRTPTLLRVLLLVNANIPLPHCQSYEAELHRIFWFESIDVNVRRLTLCQNAIAISRQQVCCSALFCRLDAVESRNHELNNTIGLQRSQCNDFTSGSYNDPEDRRFKDNHDCYITLSTFY